MNQEFFTLFGKCTNVLNYNTGFACYLLFICLLLVDAVSVLFNYKGLATTTFAIPKGNRGGW